MWVCYEPLKKKTVICVSVLIAETSTNLNPKISIFSDEFWLKRQIVIRITPDNAVQIILQQKITENHEIR